MRPRANLSRPAPVTAHVAELLTLRMTLRESDPEVVRVVEVPADYSCYELHLVLQVAMGWTDSAGFELVRDGLTVGVEASYAGDGLTHGDHRYRHADEVEAGELFGAGTRRVSYTYDFERLWQCRVALVARRASEDELPACTEAFEAAPPESVDDLDTFYGLLLAAREPGHPLHDLARQALGEDFDALGPHADDITAYLHELFGEPVEPHGNKPDESDDDWGWWDPSKYDDKMRLRVRQEEIEQELPRRVEGRTAGERSAALLSALRGART